MTSRIIAPLMALLLAAGLAGGAPLAMASSTAPVSTLHLDDPTGDVYVSPGDEPTGGRSVDVVATDIRRSAARLDVTLTYVDLSKRGLREWGLAFKIPRRNSDLYLTWTAARGHDGAWSEYGWISRVDEADEFPVRCSALRGRADYAGDTFTLRLPQACFPRRGIVIEDMEVDARLLDKGATLIDSPFGDLDDPYGTRTPRLMAPAT